MSPHKVFYFTLYRMPKMHTIIIKLGTLHCEFNNGRNGDLLIFE